MRENEVYYTHDNGGRPFKVVIHNENEVDVFKNEISYNAIDDIEIENEIFIATFYASRIFIGRSPINEMTRYSGGYGSSFDGNSILLHISDNTYVYIGEKIFSFTSFSEITEYTSPVGNSDVTYPYAKDEDGNYYLLIEDVILRYNNDLEHLISEFNDPYSYYYSAQLITQDLASFYQRENTEHVRSLEPVPCTAEENFENIQLYGIGRHQYNMVYFPFPERDYDRLTSEDGEDMYVILSNGERVSLNRETYSSLIRRFGNYMGFQPLEINTMIHDRI